MPTEKRQLEISFEQDELISSILQHGTFTVFSELNLTGDDAQGTEVPRRVRELVSTLEALAGGDGLVFAPRLMRTSSVKQLTAIRQLSTAPFLFSFRGAQETERQCQEDAAHARSAGYRNFSVATGCLRPAEAGDENSYLDSIEMLDSLNDPRKEQTLAAYVTPFVYTPEAQCAQYAMMLRKLAHGAQFLIVQSGWDMAKYQELQWFLQEREVVVPLVVRLRFVSEEEARQLHNGLEAGVCLPLTVAARLERLVDAPEEFWRYQCELLALMAIGCRKLGYAGLYLSGLEEAKLVQDFFAELQRLDVELDSYDAWLKRWQTVTEEGSMIPSTQTSLEAPFYLFANLLMPEVPFFVRELVQASRRTVPPPSLWASFRASLFAPSAHGALARLAQLMFPGCAKRSFHYGFDAAACPKHLTHGACGCVQPDGLCENGRQPCFYNLQVRLAVARNESYLLED